MKDLYNGVKPESLLLPAAALTADTNSAGADLQGFQSATVLFHVGQSGDTLSGSVYFKLLLQESDDNSTFTDVAIADMIGGLQVTAGEVALIDDPAEDEVLVKVGYIGIKRYIRGRIDVTGTHTNGTPIAITCLKSHAHTEPVS